MFERYPIHILNEDQRANLGIRRSELVRRCGFRNVAKGIRRLDALCGGYIGTLSAKAILAALPAALGLEAREVEKAVAETADIIARAREEEEAKREAAWRASFSRWPLSLDADPSTPSFENTIAALERSPTQGPRSGAARNRARRRTDAGSAARGPPVSGPSATARWPRAGFPDYEW